MQLLQCELAHFPGDKDAQTYNLLVDMYNAQIRRENELTERQRNTRAFLVAAHTVARATTRKGNGDDSDTDR